jgi:hypothetical protein
MSGVQGNQQPLLSLNLAFSGPPRAARGLIPALQDTRGGVRADPHCLGA